MILCAALKLTTSNIPYEIILPCCRHAHGYELLQDFDIPMCDYTITEGFIDTQNQFFDRKQAYNEAKKTGQLPYQLIIDKTKANTDELYSEDLY